MIRKYDKDIDLHCSSLNQVLNKDAISFWVEKYNVKRIIFPRNIAINEIIEMCNLFPNLEFEIFVKNSWCYNSDGICSSMHEEATKK
jgi:O2-independent ubiquinone biosynthesis protein UbiU